MQKSVSRTIIVGKKQVEYNTVLLHLKNAKSAGANYSFQKFECIFIPKCKEYRVKYSVSNKSSDYTVASSGDYIFTKNSSYGFHCCFLPKGWRNKRLKRSIKILK